MDETARIKQYIVVGTIGNAIGWIIYNVIYYSNPFYWNKATTSWLFSYLVGVAQQHEMHRRWTFYESKEPYLGSLGKSYVAYSVGLIVSTIVNYLLINNVEMHLQLSWFFSVLSSVVVNYFFLKRIAFKLA